MATNSQRVKFDTDAITKRAIQLRAVLEGATQEDVINSAVRAHVAREIEEVRERGLVSDPVTASAPAQKIGRASRRQSHG